MSSPEIWAGIGSGILGLISAAFKMWRSWDRRLRNLELGVARIEAHLGIDREARKSMVSVSEAPESDE